MSKKNEEAKRHQEKAAKGSGLVDAQGKEIPAALTPVEKAHHAVLEQAAMIDALAMAVLEFLDSTKVPRYGYPAIIERAQQLHPQREGAFQDMIAQRKAAPPAKKDAPPDPGDAADTKDDKPS